jgi:hypothetical protein
MTSSRLIVHAVAAIACTSVVNLAQASTPTRPDALLQIDLNRNAVVERIVSSWGGELPALQRESFKSKLMGLRADQLLSANLSGSFDGVLEQLQGAPRDAHLSNLTPAIGSAASAYANLPDINAALASGTVRLNSSPDQTKALGESDRDLLYTPVTPCRLFDTRTGQASALGTVGGVINNNSRRLISAGGACGIPTADVKSIMLSFHASTNNPPVLGIVSFMAPSAPLTAMAATWTGGVWVTGTFVAPTNATSQFEVLIGNGAAMQAHFVADVVGYFMPPTRNGDGLRVVQPTLSPTGTTGAPNVINGDKTNAIVTIAGTMQGATIAGGLRNIVGDATGAFGWLGTIGGGVDNRVGDASGGGGDYATVGGGVGNIASRDYTTIAGGNRNNATASFSAVGGGSLNTASGFYATVPGGVGNVASGDTSFAAGRFARATHDHAFVLSGWSGASGASPVSSVGPQTFSAYFPGGYYLYTGPLGTGQGCIITGAGAGQTCSSDRNLKSNISAMNPREVLRRVSALPLFNWSFRGHENVRNVGPMSQDFHAAFGLGESDKYISAHNLSSVAIAAVQGLNQKLVSEGKAKDAKIAAQQSEIAAMKSELVAIKKKLGL